MSALNELLGLPGQPVAVTFCDAPPPGVARIAGGEPAGCGYWRRAAAGEAWFAIPGPALAALEERLAVIVRANRELEAFHRARAGVLPP